MSNAIPRIWIGDSVRVMQTDEMVARGLANQRGLVIVIWDEVCHGSATKMASVQLVRGAETIAVDQLEREIRPNCGGYTVRSKHCDEFDCDDGWIDEHESDTMCEECCGTGYVRWCSDCGCDITRRERVRESQRRLFEDTEQ